jgi:hypothetical protein
MAELKNSWLRALARFGSGVGIVAGGQDLEIMIVRVLPRQARLRAVLRIADYRTRPAAEWGADYVAFLKAHSASHLAALVLLPRDEVIVRHLSLPGVSDEDAGPAIAFQLDALHPFAEDEVVYDYHRTGLSDMFTVAIAERRQIDFYTNLFAEAGVKLSGLTFSGDAIYSAMRLFAPGRQQGVLAVEGLVAGPGERVEVYGESPSHPLFSACFDMSAEHAAALALSEMRLEPETVAEDLAGVLPAWRSAPDNFDFSDAGRSRAALNWAVALAAACPRLSAPVNLLPGELRTAGSRAIYVPTIVLGVVLLGLAGALLGQNTWLENHYRQRLQAEVDRLAPVAQRTETLDKRLARVSLKLEQLSRYRRRSRANLDILLEVTETLPPPAFLTSLQIDPRSVNLGGEAAQAESLLKKLDSSARFGGSQFTQPLGHGAVGEQFRLRTQRKGGER